MNVSGFKRSNSTGALVAKLRQGLPSSNTNTNTKHHMKLFIITLNTSNGTEEFLQYAPDLASTAITQTNLGFSLRAVEEVPNDRETINGLVDGADVKWLVDQDYNRLKSTEASF